MSNVAIRCACGWQGPWHRTTAAGVVRSLRDDHLDHVIEAYPRLDLIAPILDELSRR